MKLLLSCSLLLVAVHAYGCHGGDCGCGGDCLKACRSCGKLENDGEVPEDGSDVFTYGERVPGDCKQAICKDKEAVMIIDGHQYKNVVCFQGKWHFGYPDFLEETSSAQCLSPGNQTCTDPDATLEFDETFKCVCKPNYEDVADEFDSEDPICSNCNNKRLNVTLLIDTSGSMNDVIPSVIRFIRTFLQFLKLKPTGNHLAVVTSDYSYDIKLGWGPESYNGRAIETALSSITGGDGQSYLGSGMEAVKAALVQPTADGQEHKLIVFTDGAVKHSPPAVKDITVAANNLEALKVETFVVATNSMYSDTLIAIANGVESNVFPIVADDDEDNFDVVNRLQKRVCV